MCNYLYTREVIIYLTTFYMDTCHSFKGVLDSSLVYGTRDFLLRLTKILSYKNTVLEMKIWIYWSESNSWIYLYIVLKKNNWKIYWSKQSFTGPGLEDRCSSWGLRIPVTETICKLGDSMTVKPYFVSWKKKKKNLKCCTFIFILVVCFQFSLVYLITNLFLLIN